MESQIEEPKKYENILIEKYESVVGIAKLNRPNSLNALSAALMKELLDALNRFEADENIRCIIVTGGEKIFSAGADIKEMMKMSSIDALKAGNLDYFDQIQKVSKPIIAAISGYCLGGGLELAMACDILIAGENARFGQPEINIGVMPGAGGTQRLTRAVGKYKAMDLILTGRQISSKEAFEIGLLSRIVPDESVMIEAKRVALEIAAKSPLASGVAKDCVTKAFEMTLKDGLEFERKNFYLLLGSEDKEEGMKAFAEKRKAVFKGK
ncbi:MAG: enoyl-CoA hydratase-related protein [archaeon]|nr:enoyl-CoA hydratase-related protein [archaeon]